MPKINEEAERGANRSLPRHNFQPHFSRGGAVISFNLGEAAATTREGGREGEVHRESANSHCRHDRRARARLSSSAGAMSPSFSLHRPISLTLPLPFLSNPTSVVNRGNEGRKNGQGGSPILLGWEWDLARLSHIFSLCLFRSFEFKLSTLSHNLCCRGGKVKPITYI